MIMQRLRKVTKYFLWVAVTAFILFIFFGFGSNILSGRKKGEENVIAKVNDESISYREYGRVISQEIRRISGSMGIDPLKERRMMDETINRMIMDRLLGEKLEERGIEISDEQVIDVIKNSPPPAIMRDSSFWRGGQFDYNRYQEILRSPRASNFVNTYARQLKQTLPRRILSGVVSSLARVTQAEVFDSYLDDSLDLKMEYLRFPLERWFEDEVSMDPEIFYEQNREMFRRDGSVRLGYISIPVSVSERQEEASVDLAGSILRRAENVNFDTLISIYSYMPDDRNLFIGWYGTDELPGEIISSLVGLETGEISDPVRTKDGYHIIKMVDRERDSINIHEIYLPVFPSGQSFEEGISTAWRAVKRLRSDTLELSPDFERKYISYEKGFVPEMSVNFGTFLDDVREGEVSYPMVGEDSIYVFWVDRINEGIPPYSEIEDEVLDSLRYHEAGERCMSYIREEIGTGNLPRYSRYARWHRTPYFTVDNYRNKGIDVPEKVVLAASNLEKESVSPPLKCGREVYLIKLVDREKINTEKIREKIPQIASRMYRRKEVVLYQGWLYNLRKDSKIEDNREKLYE